MMYYVYCLENHDRDYLYVGSTTDLRKRLEEHQCGRCRATKPYLPLRLSAYVALETERKARELERYFKTGSGKAILKKRILQVEAQ